MVVLVVQAALAYIVNKQVFRKALILIIRGPIGTFKDNTRSFIKTSHKVARLGLTDLSFETVFGNEIFSESIGL